MTTRTIWKFTVELTNYVTVEMPRGARVLTAQMQRNSMCLWAEVDPDAEKVQRRFSVYGTGHPMSSRDKYISTVQYGAFVWHIYEAE